MVKIEFTLPLSDEDRKIIEGILGVNTETVETEETEIEVEEAPKKPARKRKTKVMPKPEPVEEDEDDEDEVEDNVVELSAVTEDDEDDAVDWIEKSIAKAKELVKAKKREPVKAALKAVGAGRVTEIEDQDTARKFFEALEAN